MKCLACQSTNLVEGTVSHEGAPIYFQTANKAAFKQLFLGTGQRVLTGWACVHCGAVQFQVQLTDKDRKEFVQFDGPQESVVDSDQ